jgi:3-oxoacyl-(acyl-carrier-protein) synthase
MLEKGKVSPLTSPTTTLGNISSWVAQDLKTQGPDISHSMTCTTSLHAIANGVAWLKSGLTDRFLAGGSEAPLTPFTFNQFQSLGIYSQDADHPFPCRPMVDEDPLQNRMVIGEGSAVFAMERLANQRDKSIIVTIEALGFGVETLEHDTSISREGRGFEISMLQALDQIDGPDVDMVILHAPGTVAGDTAELNAIYRVFGDSHPVLISNKWLLGHSFGASAGLSIEMAIHILHNDQYRDFPYPVRVRFNDRSINRIMINAAGFGGNCTSLIISR